MAKTRKLTVESLKRLIKQTIKEQMEEPAATGQKKLFRVSEHETDKVLGGVAARDQTEAAKIWARDHRISALGTVNVQEITVDNGYEDMQKMHREIEKLSNALQEYEEAIDDVTDADW